MHICDSYCQVLQLFDTHREKDPGAPINSITITQALNACTHIRDPERGTDIHRLESARNEGVRTYWHHCSISSVRTYSLLNYDLTIVDFSVV